MDITIEREDDGTYHLQIGQPGRRGLLLAAWLTKRETETLLKELTDALEWKTKMTT